MKTTATTLGTIAFLMLCAFFGRYISDHWIFLTFSSFQAQGAALAASLALLSWTLRRNVAMFLILVASVAIACHSYFMLGDLEAPRSSQVQDDVVSFKMITFNILGDNSSANGSRIADYLIGSGADVVLIQESAPLGRSIERLKTAYPYRLGCGALTVTCDQSLWSRAPLVASEVDTASPIYRDRLLIATIKIGTERVSFANVHTTKPYFDNIHAIELKQIDERLRAYSERNPGPIVVAGDFNASILTSDIRRFAAQQDLHTVGYEPATWPVAAPELGMAIDHILISNSLLFASLERIGDNFGSNHFGLDANIEIRSQPSGG